MAEAITIARPYASAVFRLAKEKKSLAAWSGELALLAAIASNEQIKLSIDDPKLDAVELEALILKIAEGKLGEQAVNLVKVLVEYGRLALLPEIAAAYEDLKAQDEGTLEAEITAAAKPTDAQVKTVVKQLEARFGKKIEAQIKLDPQIIGGIKIVVGDTVIDASVRGQLQELAYTLKG
ncbi:ATP synthase F1 subunit delta [Methylovorus sp. MM2]|uniref:F0F1 ATP synthase subunit delta n=1 Tax=Methylovorus sp. MM2 TaxID=1848038 RepID=UPI0007DF0C72|nr:F0F1 ATP synthase subunit delta [Methylovorus sp. MM2]OAM51989.1 ATP synthase F1 subunit delta [Methylovorus sp. MM2]